MKIEQAKEALGHRILYKINESERAHVYEGRIVGLSPKEQYVKVLDLITDKQEAWYRLEDVHLVDVFELRNPFRFSSEDRPSILFSEPPQPPPPPQPREVRPSEPIFVKFKNRFFAWIK